MMAAPVCAPPILETPRLILDAHRQEDFEPLAAMWADTDVMRHISGKPSSRQESWFRLLRYRGLWPVLGYGYWAVRERRTGRFLGDVGFADFHRETTPSIDGLPEAGWVLARRAHGQGFASEAMSAALTWLDQARGFRRVVCLIDPANLTSIRIAEKNGFRPASTIHLRGEVTPLFVRDR